MNAGTDNGVEARIRKLKERDVELHSSISSMLSAYSSNGSDSEKSAGDLPDDPPPPAVALNLSETAEERRPRPSMAAAAVDAAAFQFAECGSALRVSVLKNRALELGSGGAEVDAALDSAGQARPPAASPAVSPAARTPLPPPMPPAQKEALCQLIVALSGDRPRRSPSPPAASQVLWGAMLSSKPLVLHTTHVTTPAHVRPYPQDPRTPAGSRALASASSGHK